VAGAQKNETAYNQKQINYASFHNIMGTKIIAVKVNQIPFLMKPFEFPHDYFIVKYIWQKK
jgi:hypothetical protein